MIAHSDKELASPTWKHTFGFHPLFCFLDRPEISSGEALAGIVREGRAGSNTTADHIGVLTMALAALPEAARPERVTPGSPPLGAGRRGGATHGFAAFCRDRGVAFSFGFAIDERRAQSHCFARRDAWIEASEDDGEVRDGAWVAEITDGLDLSAWPEGSRVIVRKERPHPGAQLSLFDEIEGLRHTAFICAERTASETSALSIPRLEATPPHPRPRRGPHTPGQGGGSAQPALQVGAREPRLARVRARRLRPRRLVQAHLLFRRARPRPLRDRRLSLPHLAHGGADRPGAVASCAYASIAPGPGPSNWRLALPACVRRSPETPSLCVDITPTPSGSNHPLDL